MSVLLFKEEGNNLDKSLVEILNKFDFWPKSVFIKPNLSGRAPIEKSENTDPDFLDKLIKVLQDGGCERIVIGHSSLLGTSDRVYPFDKIIQDSGFSRFANRSGVELLNLDDIERKEIAFRDKKFRIPKIIYELGGYLNLAKLKTHMETKVSLSLKNQMGLLDQNIRVMFHKTDLEENIAYLGVVKPGLSIVDGICAMEKNGPHHGNNRELNLLFAGDDMVELDSFICNIVGIDYSSVRHIRLAGEAGLGNMASKDLLDKYKGWAKKIVPADDYIRVGKSIYVWPTSSCSRCITALSEGAKMYRKNVLRNLKFGQKAYLSNKRLNFVIGKGDGLEIEKGEKIIAIGNCASRFAKENGIKCLDKCPPSAKDVCDYLKGKL